MPVNPIIKVLIFIALSAVLNSCNNEQTTKAPAAATDSIQEAQRIREISEQIEAHPDDPELLYQRAQIYFNDKLLDRAAGDMETALGIDSLNPLYHFIMGRIDYAMNKTILAAAQYEKAIAIKPDYTEAKLKLADLYFVVKEHQKSVDLLNAALKSDKTNAYIYHMLGMNYKEMGDTARAIYHFQTAVENDPADFESTLYIANLYAAKGKDLAFEYYNAALKLRPKNANALIQRAIFAQKSGMYRQALLDYRRVIAIEPDNYIAYYNVGYINYDTKKYAEALRNWDICTRMNPDYANAYYMKGIVYELQNNLADAKLNYNYALQLEPENQLFISGLKNIK